MNWQANTVETTWVSERLNAQQMPRESPRSPVGHAGPTTLLLNSHRKSLPKDAGGLGITP